MDFHPSDSRQIQPGSWSLYFLNPFPTHNLTLNMKSVSPVLYLVLATATIAYAAIGDRCNPGGRGSFLGVCTKDTSCTKSGGKFTRKPECPNDPYNIICCYEYGCKTGDPSSACMWASDCKALKGRSLSGKIKLSSLSYLIDLHPSSRLWLC